MRRKIRFVAVALACTMAVGQFTACNSGSTGGDTVTSSSSVAKKGKIRYSGTYKDTTWTIDEAGCLEVKGKGDMYKKTQRPWKKYKDEIISARIEVEGATNLASLFAGCKNLTDVDLSKFDTSKVTNMSAMFAGCKSLKKIDVSKLNTSNVKNMSGMFRGCKSLKKLDASKFDTSNVKDMSEMFYECRSLKTLNVSKFNTSNVKNMDSMFWECSSLKTIDVSSFDTSNVENMSAMFSVCKGLSFLNLSNFDTSKAEWMNFMFMGCSELDSLDLSSFDLSGIDDLDGVHCMFSGCEDLKIIHSPKKRSACDLWMPGEDVTDTNGNVRSDLGMWVDGDGKLCAQLPGGSITLTKKFLAD